jgi:hypothetical protein
MSLFFAPLTFHGLMFIPACARRRGAPLPESPRTFNSPRTFMDKWIMWARLLSRGPKCRPGIYPGGTNLMTGHWNGKKRQWWLMGGNSDTGAFGADS